MKRVYVDSCIYISFLTDEMNHNSKLKGNYLYEIFEKFSNKELYLITSTHVIFEVKKVLKRNFQEDLIEYFEILIKDLKKINNLKILRFTENDKKEARKLDNKNFADALHFIIAEKNNCEILTTENIKDFESYKGNIEILHPKDLV